MLNKWLAIGGIVLASLVYGSKAQAQRINCGGDQIQSGGGNAGYVICTPIQQPQQPQYNPSSGSRSVPKPRPAVIEKYGLGYIVVAWHPKATDVWATWNQRTVEKATKTVLSACGDIMGEGCGIIKVGWNGSFVIVRDRTNGLWQGWGETAQQASEEALQSCKTVKEGCEVLHTFTSEPLKQSQNFKTYQEYFKYQEDPANDVSKSYLPGKSTATK